MRLKPDVYSVTVSSSTMDSLSYSQWLNPVAHEPPDDLRTDAERDAERVAQARERITGLLVQLPELEAAVVRDRLDDVREVDIAAKNGVCQSAVSQALSMAVRRMKVLAELPVVTRADFEIMRAFVESKVRERHPKRRRAVIENRMTVLWALWSTSSYIRARELTGCNPGWPRVYARLLLEALEESGRIDWLRHWRLLLDNLGVRDAHRSNRWKAQRAA